MCVLCEGLFAESAFSEFRQSISHPGACRSKPHFTDEPVAAGATMGPGGVSRHQYGHAAVALPEEVHPRCEFVGSSGCQSQCRSNHVQGCWAPAPASPACRCRTLRPVSSESHVSRTVSHTALSTRSQQDARHPAVGVLCGRWLAHRVGVQAAAPFHVRAPMPKAWSRRTPSGCRQTLSFTPAHAPLTSDPLWRA